MLQRVFLLVMIVTLARMGSSQDILQHAELLTTEHGLSNNIIYSIARDARGYLWIGTDNGLNLFDGYRFHQIYVSSEGVESAGGNRIEVMYVDSYGDLWVAPEKGLLKYNYKTGNFTVTPFFADIWVKQIVEADKNTLMIRSDEAIYLYHIIEGRFDRVGAGMPLGEEYYDHPTDRIARDTEGNIYLTNIRDDQNILLRFDPESRTFRKWRRVQFPGNLEDHFFNAFFIDHLQHFWFATVHGIYRYTKEPMDGEAMAPQVMLLNDVYNPTRQIYEAPNHDIWFCRNAGLLQYQRSAGTLHRYLPLSIGSSAQPDVVTCAYQDPAGVLWIGTFHGMVKYNTGTSAFKHMMAHKESGPSLFHPSVMGIYAQDTNLLRIHYLFSISHYSLFNPVENTISHHLLPDPKDTMEWILKRGLINPGELHDTTLHKLMEAPKMGYIHPSIPSGSMWVDKKQNIWFYADDAIRLVNTRERWNTNSYIFDIRDRQDTLWIATGKGLTWLHIPTGTLSSTYLGLTNEKAYDAAYPAVCILLEESGNIWIGLKEGGLLYLNRRLDCMDHYTVENGLSNNSIYCMVKDDAGRLWLGTGNGLSCFDPASRLFKNYYRSDGLVNSEFNRYSAFKLPDGTIMMGGMDGIDFFDPEEFPAGEATPEVRITSFRVFDKELRTDTLIRLPHSENYISIEFAVMDFRNPGGNDFMYKLEGIDRDWVNADHRHFAGYPNLAPGRYRFLVRGANSRGEWSREPASVSFFIRPPWWNRTWFYLCCILGASSLVYALYRYRINHLRRIYNIRNEISQDLHDQVGATLTSISFLSEVAKLETREDAQAYDMLDKIGAYSREMISDMNDIVWSVNPANDRFEKISQRMLDYASPLLAAGGILFHFEADPALHQVSLSVLQRKNLYLIFKEAVNNAAKYAACKNVRIRLERVQHNVVLEISDDGKGISDEEREKGNGLTNMKMRAEAIGAVFTLESHPGAGTRIHVSMPITQNAYRPTI